MRFWIVGGGTGGHVYPGLAVVQALQAIEPDAALTWVGGKSGMERALVERVGLPFVDVPAGGVHGVGLGRMTRNTIRLFQGLGVALRALAWEQPDALLTTGGYVSVPVALAAWIRRVPMMIFLPDVEPALSVKFIARLAARIGVTVEDSRKYLPERKVEVTGYPLRDEIARWDRHSGREALGVPATAPVLLVFGGSRGARSINRAVLANLPALLEEVEIIHISGQLDWDEVAEAHAQLSDVQRVHYHTFPYLHEEMGAALAAADLVVSRAGASVLGEFPYFELPAVLVPYPYAWRYQKVNAQWLADRGAAIVVEDAALKETLVSTVRALIADSDRRRAMKEAARRLARPDASRKLADMMRRLGKEN
jgi:UDP-N-acetylglucosamine--N-acetylmuramyl-(pentapeptide) pyrophosphoryl-undecaprenol N-acetylglucosamine transferase